MATAPSGAGADGDPPMSIEVANESGVDVSEAELISVARFVIAQMQVNPAAELSMVLLDTAARGPASAGL